MTEAAFSFEVEVHVRGEIERGRSIRGDPPEPDVIESVEVIGFAIDRYIGTVDGKSQWRAETLLAGIDVKSADIQRLFANILALKGEEANDALFDADS
jgi:hypothetical protein